MTRYWRIWIPCRSASGPGLARGPHVEADDHRVRGGGQVDVVLADAADAGVDDVDPHLGVVDLPELADDRLDRPLHVAPSGRCSGRRRRPPAAARRSARARRRGSPAWRATRGAGAPRAAGRGRGRGGRSRRRGASSPAGGGLSKPRISTGSPGRRGVDLLAAVVVERADAPPGVAGDDRVADLQRAALDQHRRDGAAADVDARLDDRAGGLGLGVGAQHRARGPRRAGSSRAARRGSRPASRRPSRPASSRPTPRAAAPGWRGRRARGPGSRPAGRSC